MTEATKAALQRLTEAGEMQSALERIADLEAALRVACNALTYSNIAIKHIDPNSQKSPLCTASRALRKNANAIEAARAALAGEAKVRGAP